MTPSLLATRARRAVLLSTAALGAAAVAAPAASAGVTLDWSTVNAFDTPAPTPPAPDNRTWLGYLTNPTPMSARGTASPIAPATGPTVTPASARGADQSAVWTMPAASGAIAPIALSGTMEFKGGVRFHSPSPSPATGHGFTITVENPQIRLNGDGTGALYATGVHTPNGADTVPVAYDRTQPVFNLRNATWGVKADGSYSVTVTPEIAVTDYTFPANYQAGRGPDRTPNTFGSFSIEMSPATGPKGDKGDKGDAGAKGVDGKNGANGKNGTTKIVRVQTSTLAKAPFKGKAARKVRVTAPKGKKALATGTVRGRTLTVTLAADSKKKQLKGRYVLRLVGKKGAATVRIP